MKNPLLLALCVLGICLFVLFYFVSALMYKKRHNTKYHFYQMFPYEYNYPYVFKDNAYGNIIVMLASLCVVAFYQINPLSSIYSIIAIAVSILATVLTILLIMCPLRYLRMHMLLAVLMMTVMAALPLVNLFAAFNYYKTLTETPNQVLVIISMVFSGLLSLSMMILIINPKLTFKIYMEKSLDEDGREVFQRPKIILMALNEWWSIFIFFLSTIPILLINIL